MKYLKSMKIKKSENLKYQNEKIYENFEKNHGIVSRCTISQWVSLITMVF